jgi:hypothetical protein
LRSRSQPANLSAAGVTIRSWAVAAAPYGDLQIVVAASTPRAMLEARETGGAALAAERGRATLALSAEVYRVAATSFEFMSMVMVHPEVPLNSNGAGVGPRR